MVSNLHSLSPGLTNHSPQVKSVPQLGFVNKVLLAHGMAIHLLIICYCFHPTTTVLSGYERDHTTPKGENIYYLFFHRKSLPIPGLTHHTPERKKGL